MKIAIKKVDLYNIQGRRVVSFNGNQVRNVSNVTSGIYIVDITLSNGKKTNNKIIIPN